MEEGSGLYHPSLEHDSCGVGCVVEFSGKKT
ncbi:MAG: glutamate synthase domain-containing protein 1, partial [Bacteroidia bacterium]